MKVYEALLVLVLCLSEARAQGQNGPLRETQSSVEAEALLQPDLWNELKELRDMVVVQQEKMRSMEARVAGSEERLASSEEESKKLKMSVAVMAAKLRASETQVKQLQTRLSTSEGKIQDHQNRLNTSEVQIQDMKEESEVMAAKLTASETQIKQLQTRLSTSEVQIQDHQTRLNTSEGQIQDIKEEIEALHPQLSTIETRLTAAEVKVQELWNKPKVAFTAGLGSYEEVNSANPVVYKNVFTNIGNAYNPTTGIFTATLRGVYVFRFIAAHYWSSSWVNILMYKNGHRLIHNAVYHRGIPESGPVYHGSVSNGMILELEKGDRVYLALRSGDRLYESSYNNNMFSGFLLYPM